jgi:hypothetical protein
MQPLENHIDHAYTQNLGKEQTNDTEQPIVPRDNSDKQSRKKRERKNQRMLAETLAFLG